MYVVASKVSHADFLKQEMVTRAYSELSKIRYMVLWQTYLGCRISETLLLLCTLIAIKIANIYLELNWRIFMAYHLYHE